MSAPVWGVLVCSGGLAALAVLTGSGETYDATGEVVSAASVDFDLWMAGFLVFLPVGIAAYLEPGDVGRILEAALSPQVALPVAVFLQWHGTGAEPGIVYFGFHYAALMGLLFLLAAGAGRGLRTLRDRRSARSVAPAPSD
nr:hypothetical protein Ade03nite_86110 [Actinoplanes derwentensis]